MITGSELDAEATFRSTTNGRLAIDDFDGDRLREHCGVFGIFNHPDAAVITALGLHALQHRGQEAAGIVSFDGRRFHSERRLGLVGDHFSRESTIKRLPGHSAIGHVRYATTGETILRNVQPLFAELNTGGFAVGHNGNLTNAQSLRRELIEEGAIFQSTSDTEVVLHLVARSRKHRLIDRFIEALRFVRDVENGEIVVISEGAIESIKPFPRQPMRPCIFEYIYFSRPDSVVHGRPVYEVRKAMGRELARERRIEADVVVPVPDSGVPAAIGYAQESGIPFELGIIRNHYVGRTFIQPTQSARDFGVRLKHSANRCVAAGKRVALIDDSIVRGTTSVKIVRMMREAGAREVHFLIASPPIAHPDYYGIDTPQKDKLLAATHSLEEMRRYIGSDTLAFLSIDGIYRAMGETGRDPRRPQFTDHCFTGDYPTQLTDLAGERVMAQLSLLAEVS
ncbi:MAG: amidophosphoribosyltransferase [Methylocystis sp.]|nr:amidophosphoribosyltransferase [Methylocystis sp.]